jgi:hypothetical protein
MFFSSARILGSREQLLPCSPWSDSFVTDEVRSLMLRIAIPSVSPKPPRFILLHLVAKATCVAKVTAAKPEFCQGLLPFLIKASAPKGDLLS